jgi:hypothetical protein
MSWAAITATAGSTTQVIYNSSGTLTGSANLVFDGTNLGIGVASPAVPLEIDKNSGEALRLAATGANQSIYSRYIAGSPNTGNLYVGVDTATGAISGTSGGGLLWQNGNNPLAFGTNNALAMTLTQSGTLILKGGSSSATNVGITFPATQVASSDVNTLDDYEEGSWTPTLLGTTTNPTVAVNGTGVYRKIGSQVFLQGGFLNVSTVGGVGGVLLGGIPFTATNVGSDVPVGGVALFGFTLSGNYSWVWFDNTVRLALYEANSAAAWTRVDISPGTSRYIYFSISFTTA